MQKVGDRQGKMERYCSTGQSPQRAVAPTEEEEYYCTQRMTKWLMVNDLSGSTKMVKTVLFDKIKELKPK